jgi:RNA polymerase sigma factor (sigma-70 family)
MERRVDAWIEELRAGRPDAAWDLFIDGYRRLIFSAIRHFLTEPDDVMDVFAFACEALHRDDLARLRRYTEADPPTARFSSWLVVVVRHLTVDWLRHRDGRRRRTAPDGLSPLQQQIFQHVFVAGASHEECFQRLRLGSAPLTSREFTDALTATYRRVQADGGLPVQTVRRAPADAGRTGADAAVLFSPLPTPEDSTVATASARQVQALLAELEPADRLAIQLFVVDELPAAEVARIVGWPNAKMVYNRVSRGLASVRRRLEQAGIGRTDL